MSKLILLAVVVGTLIILPQSSGYLINRGEQYKYHHPSHAFSFHRQRYEPLRAIAENHIKTETIKTDDVVTDRRHNHIDQYPETSEEVSSIVKEHGIKSDELNKRTTLEEGSRNRYDYDNSSIRATLARTVKLHRAGITGRSSLAKTHVERRRVGGEKGVGAVSWVLGKMRMTAGASIVTRQNDDSHKWKDAIQSTVSDMLNSQDTLIQQQIDVLPPPGTKSIGVLGEIIQDPLPDIIPRPGTYLVGAGSRDESRLTVRSSIPHTSDDTHIANLRLSVFSQFDKEQQRIFRNRSLEVLNIRRRKGAVVLVAEEETQTVNTRDPHYLNEMQARIEKGLDYGARQSNQFIAESCLDSISPTLTVRPGRDATVTSVSSGVAVVDDTKFIATTIGDGIIIGSVECSHQEFKGTMLGNLRPTGSLMYVTEVAVRSNARRCGVGAMLMKGVDKVANLRNVETIYLHVDVTNRVACSMYEKCGYHYLDKRLPMYAQFTASLNLHDGATHGRSHFLMCKNLVDRTTWLDDDESNWTALINEFRDAV